MERSIYRMQLELQDIHTPYHLDVKRGDTGIRLILSVTDGGKPFHLTPDCMGVFTAKKPDGTCIYNACIFAAGDMVYDFTPQTTAQPGQLDCQLKLYGSNNRLLTTAAFLVTVHDTVYNEGDALASETEVTALTKLVSEANTLLTDTREQLDSGAFNGDSASIGENGNWWIGDTDTGKVAAVLNDEETTGTSAWSGKKVAETCVDQATQRAVTRTEVLELTSRDNHTQTDNGTLVMDDGVKMTYENGTANPLLILKSYSGLDNVRLRGIANGSAATDAVNKQQLEAATKNMLTCDSQSLTPDQQMQARENIGALASNNGNPVVDSLETPSLRVWAKDSGGEKGAEIVPGPLEENPDPENSDPIVVLVLRSDWAAGTRLRGLEPGKEDSDAVNLKQMREAIAAIEPGKDGYTPQKGVDYYTEADKDEMVDAVLAALPNGDEVEY